MGERRRSRHWTAREHNTMLRASGAGGSRNGDAQRMQTSGDRASIEFLLNHPTATSRGAVPRNGGRATTTARATTGAPRSCQFQCDQCFKTFTQRADVRYVLATRAQQRRWRRADSAAQEAQEDGPRKGA